jgi:hypothetical protein
MQIVKISTQYPKYFFLKQTPGCKGIWNGFKFYINDDSIKDCDYWIVYDTLVKKEVSFCPKENVFLITGEPPNYKKYNAKFVKQFHKVITCHRDMKHGNKIYWQPALFWGVGLKLTKFINFINCNIEITKTYDRLKASNIDPKDKPKLCSVISSNKIVTKEHRDRINFVGMLKNHFGDSIDVYGRGFKEIDDKWDAIAPYKYHIVIENSSFDDNWTEKLADAFLGESYPIYFGANNIYSYFDKNSLTQIDINNPEEALKIIKELISKNYYEKYRNEIIKSKHKILDEYNLFPTIISKLIEPYSGLTPQKNMVELQPEIYFSNILKIKSKLLSNKIIKKYAKLVYAKTIKKYWLKYLIIRQKTR